MSKVINLTERIIELHNCQDDTYITIYPNNKDEYELKISKNEEPYQILMVYNKELNNGDLFPVKFTPRVISDIKIISDNIISRFDTIIIPYNKDLEFIINENKNIYMIDPDNTDYIHIHDYDTDNMIYRCESLIRL